MRGIYIILSISLSKGKEMLPLIPWIEIHCRNKSVQCRTSFIGNFAILARAPHYWCSHHPSRGWRHEKYIRGPAPLAAKRGWANTCLQPHEKFYPTNGNRWCRCAPPSHDEIVIEKDERRWGDRGLKRTLRPRTGTLLLITLKTANRQSVANPSVASREILRDKFRR